MVLCQRVTGTAGPQISTEACPSGSGRKLTCRSVEAAAARCAAASASSARAARRTSCRIRLGASRAARSARSASSWVASSSSKASSSSISTIARPVVIRPASSRSIVCGSTPVSCWARRISTAAAWSDTPRATATSRRNEVHGVAPTVSCRHRGTIAANSASTRASAASC
jgi:hypothetical protein